MIISFSMMLDPSVGFRGNFMRRKLDDSHSEASEG